ncbi:MAG: SPFH domain-containing protein [Planctomycetota bacterium]
MYGLVILSLGLFLGIAVASAAVRAPNQAAKLAAIIAGVVIFLLGAAFSSVRYVGADEVGIVKKNALGPSLTGGRIIATEGEMGIQADVLSPGWHFGLWPVIYDVSTESLIDITGDQVGLVEALDGEALDAGQLFAPEVPEAEFKKMVEDASYFFANGGRKGPQSNVLTPGKYRINSSLFRITMVDQTDVPSATVAVLKANFGDDPSVVSNAMEGDEPVVLAGEGQKGVREEYLDPGKFPVNTRAFEVYIVSTKETILRFTSGQRGYIQQSGAARANPDAPISEESEITVRTSDGFTFPVDVRVEYRIEPKNAPVVVAKLGSDGTPLLNKMNSTVRAIFRNNAESVKALDYVNQRSQQERQSLVMLKDEMSEVGVTVLAVRIGDVGDEETLGNLLATQRDREIALQQQETFREQQRAAEQEKELTRTQQEAVEEKRLATAKYQVQISEQEKEQRLIAASAEAEAIRIQAEAQAEAYRVIAEQIGPGNAALVEVLRVVGDNGIQITPRVMVTGDNAGNGDAETTALIGTMLDTMMNRAPLPTSNASPQVTNREN